MGARGCRQASSEVSVENMMRPLRITHYVKEGRVVKKRKKKHRAPIITANVSGGHYQKGEIYFRRGDYAAAIKAWRAAMKVQVPETNLARKLAEAHFRYALSLDRERQITQLISELHQAIQRAPDVAIYHYHLGLAYHRKGQYDKAITAYRQALKLRPGDARFQSHLEFALTESGQEVHDPKAEILQLVQQGKYAEAHETLKQHPLGEIHNLFEGYVYAMQGNYTEAKKRFNQYTAPQYASVVPYYLGLIYSQEGKFPSAIKHLETAMNAPHLKAVCEPILLGVYKRLAVKYAEAGEQDKANRLWNKIAQLAPQDAAADNAVAVALQDGYRYASEGNFSQAMRLWRRLINQGVQHTALLQNYAIACDRNENYEAAMETWGQLAAVWERQLPTAPNREEMKQKLSLVYRRIGELAGHLEELYAARNAYQKALTYTPDDLEIRLRLVSLTLEEEDFDAAFCQLRELRRRHPDNVRVLEITVTAHLEVGDYSKALQSTLDLLKLDPKNESARGLLRSLGCNQAKELCETNQQRQAVRLLQSLVQADTAYLPFYTLLGEALLDQDRLTEAEEILGKCIEIAEDKALAHAHVGKAYMYAEYFEHAAVYFEEAERLGAEHPDVLLTIGTAYMPYDMRKANHYLNKLIASQPGNPEVFEKIARELLDADRPELAQQILNRGLKVFPQSLPLLICLITTAMTMEDFTLVRRTANQLRKLATAAGDFEVLEMLSTLEMILSFRETFGGIFGEYEYDDEPF